MRNVRLGMPIVVMVVGLILAFAISNRIDGVDLHKIGLYVAGGGLAWLILEAVLNRPRARVTQETTNVAGAGGVAPVAGHPVAGQPVVGTSGTVEREVRQEEV